MKSNLSIITTMVLMAIIIISSCAKKDAAPVTPEPNNEDLSLYQNSKDTAGFVWYKNSSAILNIASLPGHDSPKIRTRYNYKAAEKLDINGKVITGSVFAENSLIVKELFDASNNFVEYAVMCKAPSSPNADAYGWVWGIYKPDGTVESSATGLGASCTGCHKNTAGSIDLTLMNAGHP